MEPTPGGKICGVCGQDCSGKPRIKDPSGHYFCKGCYEQALAQKHAQAPATPTPGTHGADDGDPFGLEPESGWDPFGDVSADPPPEAPPQAAPEAPSTHACPSCHQRLAPGAVLCTQCGYNLATGSAIEVRPMPPQMATPQRAVWPIVIGVLSLCFAAFDILHLVADVQASQSAAGPGQVGNSVSLLMVAVIAVRGGLAAWLLLAGIGIISRRQTAVASIRAWAITKIAITATCMGCLIAALAGLSTLTPSGPNAQVGALVGVVAIIVLGVLLFWPIFVLVWFSRDFAQREVNTWR